MGTNDFDQVCAYLQKRFISLTTPDIRFIQAHTTIRSFSPNTIIMQQGKPVDHLFFLNAGVVRLFRIHNDTDYTLGLISSRDFVSTPLYLLNQEPSSCGLETLTNVNVLQWNYDQVCRIKSEIRKAAEIERAIMDRLLNWLQDGQMEAICMTAEERYQLILERQPELVHSVPLKYIASMLGIHQDSLSRIRKLSTRKH